LPELAGAVSLPVPRYEYISDPTVSPRFVGYRKIEGVPFTRERLAACRSDRPLQQLAQFLTDLHRFPAERAQALGAPTLLPDECHADWAQSGERVGAHVFPLLSERQRAWAERTLADRLNDNVMTDYTPALTHGDLWAEHILFDPEREELTGVIDFAPGTSQGLNLPASPIRPVTGSHCGSTTKKEPSNGCSLTMQARSTRPSVIECCEQRTMCRFTKSCAVCCATTARRGGPVGNGSIKGWANRTIRLSHLSASWYDLTAS